uniref:riboflavin kinase n=2 Tax=Sus scrofa TaxID=9823 RepID=A0A5G2RJ73_PIG
NFREGWSSAVVQRVNDLTCLCGGIFSIPGLAQWVKDSVLLHLWIQSLVWELSYAISAAKKEKKGGLIVSFKLTHDKNKNIFKFQETHIMHTFKEDFYGEILNVAIVGYLRPEKNFDSLESLISAIQGDIEEAKKQLDLPEHLKLKEDNFFQVSKSKIMNGH